MSCGNIWYRCAPARLVHHDVRGRLQHPGEAMDPGGDELAQGGQVLGLEEGDDVIGAGDGMRHLHAGQLRDAIGDLAGPARRGLDEHVGADRHDHPPCFTPRHSEVRRHAEAR